MDNGARQHAFVRDGKVLLHTGGSKDDKAPGRSLLLAEADGRGHRPEVTGDYRIGDVRHVVGDTTGAREALGFTAAVGPTEGMVGFARDPLRRPPSTASAGIT